MSRRSRIGIIVILVRATVPFANATRFLNPFSMTIRGLLLRDVGEHRSKASRHYAASVETVSASCMRSTSCAGPDLRWTIPEHHLLR
jgi:hypothetical protein